MMMVIMNSYSKHGSNHEYGYCVQVWLQQLNESHSIISLPTGKKNICPPKPEKIKRKFHLPTMNFQGFVSFWGNKWFFLYHYWLYSPSLLWLQKMLVVVPAKPAVLSPQVAPTYPVHNVADLAVPKKKGGKKIRGFFAEQKLVLTKKIPFLLGTCPVSAYITHKGQAYQSITCGRKLESFFFFRKHLF